MILIENANVVTEKGILYGGSVLVDGDRIAGVEEGTLKTAAACAERYDAKGLFVGPGFVDIHVHGGGGHMFFNEPEKAAEHFLRHGETTVLATLYYDLPKKTFLDAIARVKAAMATPGGRPIKGFYMEGPYMNPAYGASPEKNCWKGSIRPEDYREIVDSAGDLAKVWAIAPEREGIEEFVKYVKKVNPDARLAVGHSEAAPEQIYPFREYGLSIATHCMNATGRKVRWAGT
ncbi:MAG: amidohydrolase family protein, partial [Clostridia bacterium]|nr:amidohydrolase family protein [Clostridia bacterium]